jgi:hypothetical protein
VWRFASSAASAAVGAALAAIAFAAKGGTDLYSTTAVEVTLLVGAGLALALAVAWARPPADFRANGGLALALFGVLTLVTALSMLWSISPDLSWIETSRVLAYLAVFALAIGVGWLAPRGWTIVLLGLVVYAAVVCGYALASRVWPDALASNEIYARIGQPYGYWNAVGVTAAMGVIPAIWLGARRSGHAPANALAYPLLGIVLVALFLSYSRGSLIAAAIALAVWLAFVPLRLRSMGVLLVSGAAAAPVIAWALSKDAFTENGLPIQARESVAGDFGLLLVLMCAALLAAGLAIGFGLGRRAPSIVLRRRFGVAVVALACALPLALFSSAAFSDRGLTGTISDRFDDLTSETAKTSGGPERLTSSSSSRGRYWRQAGRIFDDRPVTGTGAGTFGMARLRHRSDQLVARHAHGYVAQTMADLGLIGLLATLALAAAWLVAAARTTGARLRPGGFGWDAERVGVAAVALTALAFGIQSALDWTWFVPGTAVPALLAAGFVAGRGPLPALAGASTPDSPTLELAPTGGAHGDGRGLRARGGWRPALQRPSRPETGRLIAAAAVAVVALLCAWAAWQPERAERKLDDALALLESGKPAAAARLADEAHDVDPLSPKPLLVKASAEDAAGSRDAARRTLEQAVREHRSNAAVWLRLAEFQLAKLGQPLAALETIRGALYLDPRSTLAQQVFFDARARLRGQAPPGAPPVPPATGP